MFAMKESENTASVNSEKVIVKMADNFGPLCKELARKFGCDEDTIISQIIEIGYKSLKTIADGEMGLMTILKDGKIHTEILKKQD